MDNAYFRKISNTLILVALIVLSFFLLKPILMSIIMGIILAYIFNPIYVKFNKVINSKSLSILLISLILATIIILPVWFLTPIAIDQSIKIYTASQQVDFATPLKNIFPSLFASEQFSSEVGSILSSFVTKTANSLMNSLSTLISNFVVLSLKLLVVFFTFYFVLKDKEKLIDYIKSLSPFSKELENKLFNQTKAITSAVLYGQVVIGILQGLSVGIGFFLFGAPNALILTLLACLAGIFPIIGTTIVWLPVIIYMFIGGDLFSSIGIVVFGVFSTLIDNFLRPLFVSKRTKVHPALIFAGMIGGLFLFGILGFILGPLVLAYLVILLEIYKEKDSPGIFIKYEEKEHSR